MWDAPTPRAVRGEEGDGALGIDSREWEEEQTRLDRDWYTGAEEGGVAGDEENNPLAQYDDLSALKEAEIATKQVVSAWCECLILTRLIHGPICQRKISARQAQYVCPFYVLLLFRRSLKHCHRMRTMISGKLTEC